MLWQQQYVLRSVVQADSVTSCRCRACEPFYARKFIAKNWVVKYFSYAQRWKHAQRKARKNKRTKFFSIFWSRRMLLCGCTVQANSRFHSTFFMQNKIPFSSSLCLDFGVSTCTTLRASYTKTSAQKPIVHRGVCVCMPTRVSLGKKKILFRYRRQSITRSLKTAHSLQLRVVKRRKTLHETHAAFPYVSIVCVSSSCHARCQRRLASHIFAVVNIGILFVLKLFLHWIRSSNLQ